jgi:malate synthase
LITTEGLTVTGPIKPGYERVLTPEALRFIAHLEYRYREDRKLLLRRRFDRQVAISKGEKPDFLQETASIRQDTDWRVAPAPKDLADRRVEITGPVDRKMMINALNSGAKVFMADFEDATSPTWDNLIDGQINAMDAARRALELKTPEGKSYALNRDIATLVVRPRGWHLPEKHVIFEDEPVTAGLFDFGLYMFHNAKALLDNGSGPYFYLPKLESHLEARVWNAVFVEAQQYLGLPVGTVRATVLIETILAAFEMDEILWELKDHAAGLNAGRWDYIFSMIKKFHDDPAMILPDRAQVTMGVPFMRAYSELLVRTCHLRGAHAIGGMAAFIPNRKDPEVTERALAKVREDKEREAGIGFDGTWVAHPDLVPVAKEIFDRVLGDQPHQKTRLRDDVHVNAAQLLATPIPGGAVTESGVRNNINVALQYLASWLQGVGAVAIHNLMEDAATAEIARAQLWQWIHHGVTLDDGRPMSAELYRTLRDEELKRFSDSGSMRSTAEPMGYDRAAEILDALVLTQDSFAEFLTLPAYQLLEP